MLEALEQIKYDIVSFADQWVNRDFIFILDRGLGRRISIICQVELSDGVLVEIAYGALVLGRVQQVHRHDEVFFEPVANVHQEGVVKLGATLDEPLLQELVKAACYAFWVVDAAHQDRQNRVLQSIKGHLGSALKLVTKQ